MTSPKWFVYIVECARGALYTGITTDVLRRVGEHNARRGSKAVIALGLPVKLVYTEQMISHSAALRREREIKSMNRRVKQCLIMLTR